jgi:hypothetical protein
MVHISVEFNVPQTGHRDEMNKVKGEKWGRGGGGNAVMLAKKGDQDRGKFLCISPGAHLSSVSGTASRILG